MSYSQSMHSMLINVNIFICIQVHEPVVDKWYEIYFSIMVPWFSPIIKEWKERCFVFSTKYGCYTCSRAVLIMFTVRVTKWHPVNISFLKRLVQWIIEAKSVWPCKNWNKNICTRALSQNKIYVLVHVRVIKSLVLVPSWVHSYAQELVLVFYSAIKKRVQMFYFLIELITSTISIGCNYVLHLY